MNIIYAPHPDDEILGCYQIIEYEEVEQIRYVEKMIGTRRIEAQAFCKEQGIRITELGGFEYFINDILNIAHEAKGARIYIPSPLDDNALHKAIYYSAFELYCRGRIPAFTVYSAYMNDWFVKPLRASVQQDKLELLNKYYPGQKGLWETNNKLYMFEGRTMLCP